MNKVKILCVLSFFCLTLSADQKNLLLGDWEIDQVETLQSLRAAEINEDIQKKISCYERLVCGNQVIRFDENKRHILYRIDIDEGEKFIHQGDVQYRLEHHSEHINIVEDLGESRKSTLKIILTKEGFYIDFGSHSEFYKQISPISNAQIIVIE